MPDLNHIMLFVSAVLCMISAFWSPAGVHLGWFGLGLFILTFLIV